MEYFDKYTLNLSKPLEHNGKEYRTLSFDFGMLTGRDSLSIEQAVLKEFGKTVLIKEYTSEYLLNMAAFACTNRDEQGNPFVTFAMLLDLPLRDYNHLCTSARLFLLGSESSSETADNGSEKPA